jgi:hypothetical protein
MAYPMAERRFEQGIYHKEQFRAALQKNSHEIALFSLENFADFLLDEIEKRKHYSAKEYWGDARSHLEKLATNTATGTDIVLLNRLVKDLGGYTVKFRIKTYGGKPHIILKGYPGLRRTLNAPKYGIKNAKILEMGLGVH